MSAEAMTCERILELVPKVVDGEALDWERDAVRTHTAGCPGCAEFKSELVGIGEQVRGPVLRAVAETDFSGFWKGVDSGIGRARVTAMPKAAVPSIWAVLSRFGAAAAVAAMLFVAVGLPGRQATHGFLADNSIEVNSVEGGVDNTVMIYESPDDHVTFIWVIAEVPDEENVPI